MENEEIYTKSAPYPSARTDEGREQELINLAFNLVERRLREGTATSQETVHFLKLGSSIERAKQEQIKQDMELTRAKIEAIESTKRIEELYSNAIAAFQSYRGET